MERTKLDFNDCKFVIYLFFSSIWNFMILNTNEAKLKWMLMCLTASGRFEKVEKEDKNDQS